MILQPEIPTTTFTMKTRQMKQTETQEEIRARGGYSRPMYFGSPTIDASANKEKLQNKMAFGVEDPVAVYRANLKTKPKEKPVDRYS